MDGFYDKPFYSCKNKIKTKELNSQQRKIEVCHYLKVTHNSI